jgi:hypothetical protein
MQTKKTIEEKVAEAILQKTIEITVGDKIYTAAPPSTATLILASEAISQLPRVTLDPNNLVEESLSIAKDCRVLGDIVAIFILGAKNLTEEVKKRVVKEKYLLGGLIKRKYEVEQNVIIDRKAELSKELLENLTPGELHSLTANLLQKMDLGDFFGLTTFLIEINLLRQTKVVNGATASGQ